MYRFLNSFVGLQYPIFMIATFFLAFRFGKTTTPLIPWFTLYWVFCSIYFSLNSKINKDFKNWVIILVAYFLLSGVGYAYNGVPLMAYYLDFRMFLCPMLLVLVGAVNTDRKVYYWYIVAVSFCVIVGLYLYIFQPSWYLSFKVNAISDAWYVDKNITEENVMLLKARFSSFFVNIYPVSFFSVFAFCILINDLYKRKELRLVQNRFLQIGLLLIIIVGILYTMVRVAFLYIILITICYFLYGKKTKNDSNKYVMSMLLTTLSLLFVLFVQIGESGGGKDIIESVFNRLGAVSYDEMMTGSRTDQNIAALTAWQNYLTGDGMGSRGGYARGLGLPGISDGGWTKFLIEYGFVGLILFISFVFATFKRAFKSLRYYTIELSIFCYGLIAMIGSDTLSKGWMVTIMWIAVGRIWNEKYLIKKIENKDCI